MTNETWATTDEIALILAASEDGDELKINYQNQDGAIIGFIPRWNCNLWAFRVLNTIRSRNER